MPPPLVGKRSGLQLARCSCENALHFPGLASHYAPDSGLSPQSLCAKEPAHWDSGTARVPKSLAGQGGGHLHLLLKFLIQWVLWSGCGRVLSEKLLLKALCPFAVALRGKAWCGIAGALERECGTPVSCPFSRFFSTSHL